MTRTTMLTVAGIAVGGLVAYAVYFDYRRRTDAGFRKQLRKEKKRIAKSQPLSTSPGSPGVVEANLKDVLESVRKEKVLMTPEEKEKYFMAQVGQGEQLSAQGSEFHLDAATCFYRALRVYPSPVELIVIYERTVPPPVFKLVMDLTNLDVKERIEGYYNYVPSKAMNVAVKFVDVPTRGKPGDFTRKKILVCTKDMEDGELIYKEEAVVTALDMDLQGKETHCSHCLRNTDQSMTIRPENDRLSSVYCSEGCRDKAQAQSQSLLFMPTSTLGAQLVVPDPARRDKAQKEFAEHLRQRGKAAPELVARLIARQTSAEIAKMLPNASSIEDTDLLTTDGKDYSLYDHLERLRYLEVTPSKEEMRLFREVLATALPGLEQFLTEERHATNLGGMNYNAFGVCFGKGRDNKPEPTEDLEDVEKTRTPLGTQKQVGTGFYVVSSYLCHSCDPSARPSFDNGNAELHLRATRALKAGDELTVAYVDVSRRDGESVIEARRRRRTELARGWRFECICERCVAELDGSDEGSARDESKVSQVVRQVEGV